MNILSQDKLNHVGVGMCQAIDGNRYCGRKTLKSKFDGQYIYAPVCFKHIKYNGLNEEQLRQLEDYNTVKYLCDLFWKLDYNEKRIQLDKNKKIEENKNNFGGLQYYDFYKLAAKLAKTLIPETFIDAEQSSRLLEFYQQLSLSIHELRNLKLVVQGTRLNIVDNSRPDKVLYPNVKGIELIEELGNLLKFDITKRRVNG